MHEESLANLYKIDIPLPKNPLKALKLLRDRDFRSKFDY
jgi:hypothetical protein